MGKTRKNNGERKLIFGAVILLIISAILFGLATDQGMNLIKNIQDRVMLKTSITISSANNEALKNKTTEAKIVAGTNHFIALTQDGKVYGWGSNGSGELGQNNTNIYKRPTYLGIDDAIDIAAGYQSTVVLKKDGTVWMAGLNSDGQLGIESTESQSTFVQVKNEDGTGYLTNIKSISAGQYTMFAITNDGEVYGWGENGSGQLGISNTEDQKLPVKTTLTNIKQISTSYYHTIALTEDGKAYVAGRNNEGELGIGQTTSSTITTWTIMKSTNGTSEMTGIKQVATGYMHTVVLTDNGYMYATGNNGYYQLSDGSSTQRKNLVYMKDSSNNTMKDVKEIYAAGNTSVAITNSNGIYVVGENSYAQLLQGNTSTVTRFTKVKNSENIDKIAMTTTTGSQTTAYVDNIGRIFTIGYAGLGQLGDGSLTSSPQYKAYSISDYRFTTEETAENLKAGETKYIDPKFEYGINLINKEFTLDLTYESLDTDVVTVEDNKITAVGIGTTYVKIIDSTNKIYGTVKVNVNADDGVTYPKVVGGYSHFVGLKSDGTVWTWGYNGNGQLGTGDQTNRTEPTKTKVEDAVDVTAGYYFTAILKKDGTVWISGDNTYGQLGDGTTTNSSEFKQVPNLTDVIQISAGSNTMHVLKKDGTVWSWGRNDCGEYGDGTTVSKEDLTPSQMIKVTNVMQIAAGNLHTAVLTAEGTVWAAGRNSDSQLGFVYNNKENTSTPREMQGLSEVKEIACGEYNTLMLQKDGYAYGVGENSDGQLGTGGATTITSPTYMKNSKTGYSLSGIKHIASAGRLLMVTTGENGIYVAGAADHAQNFTESTTKRTTLYQTQTDKKVLAMACTRNISYQTGLIIDEKGRTWTVGYDGQGQVGQGAPEHTTKPVNITKTKISLAENGMISLNQKGDKYQLKHTEIVGLSFLTNKLLDEDIVYSSMDNEVATVDENGVITAVGEGTTYIKVKDQNNEVTNAIKVSVTIKNNETQPKVVGGGYYFAALKGNGTVYTWGYNGSGQLGLGDTNNRTEPTQTNMKAVIDIAAGTDHTLVLKADGTVWATGLNNYGQLGNGTTENTNTFQQVKLNENGDYLENIVSIAAGYTASYAVTAEGEVYGWGRNDDGELGIGSKSSEINELYPVKMKKVSKIIQIAAGANHAIMLDADGNVWSTGYNSSGQLGIGNTDIQVQPKQMTSVSGVKEIAAGTNHSIMLAENGYVYSVGNDSNSQLGNGNSTNISTPTYVRNTSGNLVSDAKHVKAGGDSTYISRKKDTEGKSQGMYVIGYNNYGQLFTQNTTTQPYAKEVEKNLDILEIAPTQYSTALIVDGEGNVYTVGYNGQGQLGNGTYESLTSKICISNTKVVVNPNIINYKNIGENNQKVECKTTIGFNLLKENIEGSTYEYKTLDQEVATVAKDGTVTATGIGTTYIKVHDTKTDIWNAVRVNVNGSENKAQPKVVGGNCHYAALKGNGTVWTWGYNGNGQLGLGDTNARTEPTQAKAEKILEDGTKEEELITDAIDIAASYNHTIILRADGTVWSTGYNQYGELGTGDTEERKIFTQVKGPNGEGILENIVQITTGYYTGYALTTNGEVYGWGSNRYGELGQGSKSDDPVLYPTKMKKVSNIIQISSGAEYIVMLDAEGKVWGTGYNGNGQLGIGNTTLQTLPQQMTSISGIKEISAKSNNTYMLTEGGYVEGVGYNYYSQLGDGSSTDRTTAVYTKNTSNKYVSDAKHISAGENSVFISRKKDSEGNPQGMYVIGRNDYGQLFTGNTTRAYYATEVEKEKDILTMALTEGQTGLMVDAEGNVYTVGYNGQGQLGNGTYESLTSKICISNTKVVVNPNIINYKNIGENNQKVECKTTIGFNLLKENIEGSTYEYKTLDQEVATVAKDGTVTATGIGTTYIKVHDTKTDIWNAVRVNVNGAENKTQPKVVGGGHHYVALKGNGTVYTWGYNNSGELGLGDTNNRLEPTQTNMKNVIDIAAGYNHTIILKSDGTVWTSGQNKYGQLGDGSTVDSNSFHKVKLNENGEYLENIVSVAAGYSTSYAVTSDGEVYGWGSNDDGELGQANKSTDPVTYPVKMKKISNIIQVAAGANHAIMLDVNGNVWATGYNSSGQLGTGDKATQTLPQQMVSVSGIKEIAAGTNHSVMLTEGGNILSAGSSTRSQMGDGSSTDRTTAVYTRNTSGYIVSNAKHIAAGGNSTYISRKKDTDGKSQGMYVIGENSNGQLFTQNTTTQPYAKEVETDKDILTMALTENSTGLIVDEEGNVYTVGYNGQGQLGNGTYESLTSKICISNTKVVVNPNIINYKNIGENNQKVECKTTIGFNLIRDEVEGSTYEFSTLDSEVATVAEDGTVTAEGIGTTYIKVHDTKTNIWNAVRVNVNGSENKAQPKVVGGNCHYAALKGNGTVWTWGYNGNGQLGLGDTNARTEPTQAKAEKILEDGTKEEELITDAIDIAASYNHTIILRADGTVWSTGYNQYGELGTGDTEERKIFTQVKGPNGEGILENIVQITTGYYTGYALTTNGEVYGWGSNRYGELGQGSKSDDPVLYPTKMKKVSNIIQISSGAEYIVMLDAEGKVWGTGYNGNGQLGIGNTTLQTLPQQMTSISGIKEISAKSNNTYMLTEGGYVEGVGYNYYSQLGDGSSTDRTTAVYTKNTSNKYVSDAKHISAGENSVFISRKKDSEGNPQGMYVIGRNDYGQLFTGNTTRAYYATEVEKEKDILTMALTEGQTGLMVDAEGNVYTVGYNGQGQLGNGTYESLTSKICISNTKVVVNPNIINYKNIGENNQKVECKTTIGFNLLKENIEGSTYEYKTLDQEVATVAKDGTVTATGIGTTYIKVHDTKTDIWNAVRVNVNGSENKAQPKVVGGNCHYAALKGNGTVWTWGYNGNGQLGLGDTNARTEPTQAKAEKILEDGTKEEELITDAIDIAASYNHTIILRADGTVWSTGYNQYGELGTGDTEERKIFTQVKGPNGEGILENIVQITTGYYTGYALTTNGEVYGWGSNRYGELGQGSKSDDPVLYPTKMKKVSNIIQISSGAEYIVMLDAEGKVWGTGYNGNGQLGIGNTTLQTLPQQMTSISGIKEISAKSNNTYMLTEGGYVEGVGYNYYSQLGDGSSTDRTTAVYTKNTSNKYVSDAKHISAGENSVFISRKKDSEGNPQGMYVIGRNDYGQLFTGNTTRAYYATEVEKEKDILTMALTEGQTGLIVDTKGNVYTVGYNGQGQIGNGTYENTTEKVFISQVKLNTTPKVINYKKAGDTGEKIEYTVTAGFNLLYEEVEKGECEYKTQDDQIATVDDKGVVTATGTGTTYIKVYNKQNDCYAAVKVQVNGEQGRTAAKIVGGGNHFVALKANGEVWTWGYNGYGQLGIGNTETKNRPTKTNIYNSKDETQSTYAIDVAAGYSHTLVLKSDGTVWAAGYNEYGQLGDSSTTNTSEFVQVTGIPEKVIAITAGGHSSYALTESGKVYGWGYNYEGQLGRGSTSQNNPNATPQKMQKVSNIIQMSAGDNHIVMLDADGTVWSTGHNYYGQLGTNNKANYSIPQQMRTGTTTVLNNIKKVSAGSLHTLALAENGTVYSLGYNYYGQLGTRNTTNYMLPVTMVDSKGNTVTGVKDIEANGYTSILSIKPTTTGTEGNLSQTAGIYVTGYNNYGQLFNQDTKTLTSLTKVQEDKNIITMASTQSISSQTSAIVDDSGLVYTVGYNGYGAMGNKTTTSTTEPANISEASLEVNTRKIVLNLETNNLSKQIEAKTDLGFNLLIDQVENEEITYKTLDENIATVTDAGLVTGQNYGTTKIEVSTNKLPNKVLIDVQVLRKNDKTIAKTVSGTDFTLALKADGTVWSWGYNGYGQLGLGDNSNRYRPTQINIENVVDIAAGNNHALLVTEDGKIYSFGSNSYGQLGRTGNAYTPEEIPNLENIEKVAAGNYHSMAIDKEGNVYTWGYNQNGQLGDGTRISNSIPTKIKLTNITKIATKNNTSAAIDGDGNLYTWGYNYYGQQGITTDNVYTPRKVSILEKIIDVAVENNTIIVLDQNGEVLASGYNTYGNLGNNTTQTRKSFDKVIEKYETITTGEGEEETTTTTPVYLSGIKSIEAGNEYAVAIKEDGTAISWGYNGYSQSSNGTTTNNLLPVDLKYGKDKENIDKIINVSAGEGTIVVVREDGKVWTIGKNYSGQLGNSSAVNSNEFVCISKPVLLFEETPIRIKGIGQNKNAKVNMSQGFNLLYTTIEDTDLTYQIKNEKIATVEETTGKITAVKKGKTAVTVTDKKSGETTSADVYVLGEEDVTFPQIETQNYSTVTLKSNGEIWSYGYNGYGQLGTGDTTYKVLPTYTGINNITQISLGGTHTLALDTEGHVWSWGYNGYGELGNGTTTSSTEKVQVKSPDGEGVLENIVAISAGNYHSIALDKDGNVYTWGYNGYGQLGLGNTTNTVLPVKVDDLEGIIKIEAGNYTSYVIDNNNHLWSTGYNYYGELGNGSTSNRSKFTQIQTLENVSDVSASETNSTIVLLSDGTVWGFGNNTNNQLTTVGGATPQQLKGPDGMLKDITSISVGYYTGYAITSEEKVVAWGLDNYSQLASTKTGTTKETPVYMKEKDGNDFTDAMIVSGGRYSAELAKSDGTVWGVGYNGYGNIGDGTTNSKNQITCISTPHIKLEEREVTLKLSNPNYQINPKTVYGFNILFEETENAGFTYKTSDETIAKIDEATGKVTATGLGKAYITVTAKGTEEETRVVINVIGENKKVEEKVQVGSSHSLALKQDGTIWSWGNNTSAINTTEPIQIEKGKYKETKEIETPEGTTQTTTTEKEIDLNNIKDIAVGYNHNLALDSEGHVYSWGYNGYGQLGDDSTSTKEIPTRIESLEEIEKVYCYKDVSMAINKQGEIYIWGYKYNKTPTKINFYGKAISLNEKLILAEDGSVWNLSDNPSKIDGLKNIVEVTSGENHYAALDSKGKVWVWGYNRYGQLSQGNTTNVGTPTTVKTQDTEGTSYQDLENIVEIQAGENTLQMLSSTGEIYISGYNGYGQLGEGESTSNITIAKKAKNMDQVKNIDTNTNHSIASDRSGFVYTTGYNGNGQLGIGSNVSTNEYTVIGDTYVHVSENRISIEEGKDKQVTATLDNKFNLINDLVDQNNITYETLNNEIAIVDQDGTIHANKMGTVEIIATHTITHKSTTIFVQVVPVGKVTVPKLEIGATHTAALKTDGTVWTWGSNSYGQLGTGDNINKAMPAKVMDIENAIDISVGSYNTVVVKDDGTVWSFGYNGYGQLGDGTSSSRNTPVQVIKQNGKPLEKIVKISAGTNKTIALDENGNVWVWGNTYKSTATKLTTINNAIDISPSYVVTQTGKVYTLEGEKLEIDNILRVSEGTNHALFLTKEGTGYSIGANSNGQLGDGTTVSKNSPTVIKTEKSNLTDIKELKAGSGSSMAIMKNGDTYTWGSNNNNKLGTTATKNQIYPTKLENVNTSISGDIGTDNGGIIDIQGFVYMWGLGTYGNLGNSLYNTSVEPVLVGAEEAGLDEYDIILHLGETHQITVTNKTFNVLKEIQETGTINYNIGNSNIASISNTGLVTGQKEGKTTAIVTKADTGATSIANVTVLPEGVEIEPMALTCMSHTVVLKANGTVWAYGLNSSYELGNGTSISSDRPIQVSFPSNIKITQIAVGNTHNLALDTEGNVWVWGVNSNNALGTKLKTIPSRLGISNVKKIAANNDQSMILTKDGYVYVWGLNSNGELGVGTYKEVKTPTLLNYVNNILDISIGKNHTMLLTTKGKVLTSGLNSYGQTGKTEGKTNIFTQIEVPATVGKISAGDNHSVLLTTNGEVYTFGYNENGQLGLGTKTNVTIPTKTNMTNIMEISAGRNHTVVLGANRVLYSTGSNSNGQLGIGTKDDKLLFTEITKVQDMMSISSGNTYNVAIKYDGNVYGWGDYYHGTASVKTKTNSRVPVKIGNDSSYAEEPEITVNVNGAKQIQITPKYSFNVFKEDNEEDSDFQYESLNEDIATVGENGLVTGVKVGTTWIKVKEVATGKENIVIVRVIESDSKYASKIAGGDGYAAVLKADGSIWGFGYNSDGQLGNDKLAPINVPSQTNILATYKQIEAGKKFTIALREDGTVWAWGDNTYGQLGQGNRVSAKKPVQVQNLTNIVSVAAGDNHAIAIDKLGNVYTWGLNSKGQLGNRTTETVSIPEKITGLDNQVVKVAAGGNLSAIIDSTGDVYVFGDNSKEQIEEFKYNYDEFGQKILPALNTYVSQPIKVQTVENAVKVQCLQTGIVVLKTDGSVERTTKYAKQANAQKTTVINSGMVDISGKNESVVLLDKYGASYTYGDNSKGQAGIGGTSASVILQKIRIAEEKTYLTVGAGYKDNYVIDTEGFVYGAGANEYGQLGNSTYDESYDFTLVGDRNFEIVPDARTMKQPEQETVKIVANIFNVFNHNERALTDYDWKSSNTDVVTVDNGVLASQDMGTATITATDKATGVKATALRVVQPLDEQRIQSITVNNKEAKVSGENKYEVSVEKNLDGTGTLKITTKDSADEISIDGGTTYVIGGTLTQDIPLDTNPTVQKIKVKASNGKTVDYILTINILSNDASLESLTIDNVQATSISSTEYEIIVKDTVTKPEVHAVASDSKATVSIDASIEETKETTKTVDMTTVIKKTIPVQVTSENGDKVTYTLTIYKEDALTQLETITVDGKEATKIGNTSYKATIPADADYSTIMAKTLYSKARAEINELGEETQVTTKVVATTQEQTIVKIYVRAGEGENEREKEYTLTLDKQGTELIQGIFSLTVNGQEIEPIGNIYNAYISENAETVAVTAITINDNDLVKIGETKTKVHISTEELEIAEEETTYRITVTDPEDSTKTKEYILKIRKPSADNSLLSVTVGNEEFSKVATREAGTNNFKVNISDKYSEVDVIGTVGYDQAKVSVNGEKYETKISTRLVEIGKNEPTKVEILVKALNGEVATYTLEIYTENSNTNLKKVTVDGKESNNK